MPTLLVRDRKTGRETEVPIRRTRFTIGKSQSANLVLVRPTVSGRHCRIQRRDGSWYLEDLGSTNGTVVDGSPIDDEVVLEPGTSFQVGDFDCTYRDGEGRADGSRRSSARVRERTEAVRDAVSEREPAAEGVSSSPDRGGTDGSSGSGPVEGAGLRASSASADDEGPTTREEQRKEELRSVKRALHEGMVEDRELKRADFNEMEPDEARALAKKVIQRLIDRMRGKIPRWIDRARLLKEVLDEALGLGPLEDLLEDDQINEIMVNNWDQIYVERKGEGIVLSDKQFSDNEQVVATIRRIIAPLGRRINETTPMVDARLPDGSRVNAIIAPLAVSGPSLTIRKFGKERFDIDDLLDFETLTPEMARFLALAVRHRMNICISGGTGSGKTTLLNCLSAFIPRTDRIVTIEDVSELKLPQEHVVSLEARSANLEGKGEVPIRDLVKNSLRMRPDRIVVGECRGGEALDMLQAMNTGHDGSLTTVHSNSPRDCISRLETLVLMAGMELPARAIREQVSNAIHIIVQQSRLVDGTRKITHISEVCGMEGSTVTLQDIFTLERTGFDEEGNVLGYHTATGNVPNFVQQLRQRGIEVDMSMFQPTEEHRRRTEASRRGMGR